MFLKKMNLSGRHIQVLRHLFQISFTRIRVSGRRKVFCIGLNKTGTTSVQAAYRRLGLVCGNQRKAQALLQPWAKRNFSPIIRFCRYAEAFQDSPFSFPFTYQALYQAFPTARFILTVRDSSEQWYESLTRFHSKKWSPGRVPTKEDLQQAVNGYKGRPWEVNRLLFNTPESDPYNRDMLLQFYDWHFQSVIEFFKTCPDSLLVLNVKERDAFTRFCEFLGYAKTDEPFPWENQTSKVTTK